MHSLTQTIPSSGPLNLTLIFTSVTTVKKSKLATSIPSGLLKGYVLVATISHSTSAATTAAMPGSSHGNTIDLDTDFKMGGFENLDEDGNEVADKKYPKYTAIRASGKSGFQVCDSNLKSKSEYSCMMVDLLSQALVNVNMNQPTQRLNTSGTLKNATKASLGSKTTFTNADLPPACLPLWNELYVQLLNDWAGTVPNPWSCHDANIQGNLQALWDVAYPSIKADIQPKQAIFVRVCSVFFFKGISH